MKQFFSFWFVLTIFSLQVFCSEALPEAKSPGEIIIGGLFPIHESVDDKGSVTGISLFL